MNRIALILIGLTLGQTVPVVAHAQGAGRLAERTAQAVQAQQSAPQRPPQGRPDRGDSGNRVTGDRARPQIERGPPAAAMRAPVRLMPFNQVINQIQRNTPGRLLDASPPDAGSARPTYGVRWQADTGQRIDFVVDAQSGAIVGRNGG